MPRKNANAFQGWRNNRSSNGGYRSRHGAMRSKPRKKAMKSRRRTS